ncbi:uncharacterized protein LOC104893277 [Beta vulgaris subsp. vulgaris]|uniref:uncharacterized protein LOC104893277 n=1 Tax=Beta vulgaris subsp. vulgaris TaxID=3555 RepID=UPI00053FCB9A|nr:uncharacterized protein LOC104893277 [Beta vulgaris subsp. vulgaris]
MPKFSIKKVYKKLIGVQDPEYYDKFMWNRLSIPKHRLIAWMAMKERLWTKDRLMQAGVVQSDECQFCVVGHETHIHRFFQCKNSHDFLQITKRWLGYNITPIVFHRIISYLRRSKRNGFQRLVMVAVLSGLMYQVWWARNEACWNGVVWRPEVVARRVQKLVVDRIFSVLPHKLFDANRVWLDSLRLNDV